RKLIEANLTGTGDEVVGGEGSAAIGIDAVGLGAGHRESAAAVEGDVAIHDQVCAISRGEEFDQALVGDSVLEGGKLIVGDLDYAGIGDAVEDAIVHGEGRCGARIRGERAAENRGARIQQDHGVVLGLDNIVVGEGATGEREVSAIGNKEAIVDETV